MEEPYWSFLSTCKDQISIRIALFLMLVAQCVESNPDLQLKVVQASKVNIDKNLQNYQKHHAKWSYYKITASLELPTLGADQKLYIQVKKHSDASSQDPASTIDTIKDVFSDPRDDQSDSEQMDTKSLLLDIRKDVKSMNRRFDQFK